jgi:cell wall-associated NlpC family hydrolase
MTAIRSSDTQVSDPSCREGGPVPSLTVAPAERRGDSGHVSVVLAIIAAGIAAVLLACMVFTVVVLKAANAQGCDGGIDTGVEQPGASSDARSIPSNYLALYRAAGGKYGIPWNILAGIGYVESRHGANPGVSSAGARGPMQFMPRTWAQYGGGGDIMNPADAIPAAARYLKASGAPNWHKAIWAYNHSEAYYKSVTSAANRYASGGYAVSGDNPAGTSACTAASSGGPATMGDVNGTIGERIVAYASKWLGTAYQFGGGDNKGPSVGTDSNHSGKPGFDCSGLTKYAVYQATNGKISLAHYVPSQWDDPHVHKVPYDQLQPGDLIAMHDWGHEGIFIGGGKMIHAPHTGDVVKKSDIRSGWYRNAFITGGRVTP